MNRFWNRSMARTVVTMLFVSVVMGGAVAMADSFPVIAMEFDGDSYIEADVNAEDLGVAGNAARTVEAWVYTGRFDDNGAIFSMGAPGSSGKDFALRVLDSQDSWRIQFWGSGDVDFEYPSLNRWVHFALAHDGETTILYADGEAIAEQSQSLETSSEEPFRIGYWSHRNRDEAFHGKIAEVRVWSRALTQDEVASQMNQQLTGKEDGLVAYWPLAEKSGDVAREHVAGNHGRVIGAASWSLARTFAVDLPTTASIDVNAAAKLGPVVLQHPKGDVTYQWYHNGEPVDGATEAELSISSFTAAHTGSWKVEVTDDSVFAPYTSAVLRVEWPVWAEQPESVAATIGSSVTLGPAALYAPYGSVSYQWYRGDEPVPGATDPVLHIESLSEADYGTYRLQADDDLETTPVFTDTVSLVKPDWPMWQYDAARSGNSPMRLADSLHLQWVRELPAPRRAWPFQWDDRGKLDFDMSYVPVVLGQRMFVPSNATDSLSAYDIEDGSLLWRFFANGPVRLAPAAWRDRVFFTSDDGHLYCVSAETGELLWKHAAGPTDQRFLGNERIVNIWAARGGPVVKDGIVYYAAGIFPLHGVFIYALDATTGAVEWVNDTISSDYVRLPHGRARGYGGLSPQGYIAADKDRLIVSAGRGQAPVTLDRETGRLKSAQFRGRKGGGGYAVNALSDDGLGYISNDELDAHVDAIKEHIDGDVFYQLAAHDRLFVVTEEGRIYCFGPEATDDPVVHAFSLEPLPSQSTPWEGPVRQALASLGETEGYALLLGAGGGDLLRELLNQSDMHVVVVESDTRKVASLREVLADRGLYGGRVAVVEADPARFAVQPYLFSVVMSEDAQAAGLDRPEAIAHALGRLRPYGGIAYLANARVEAHDMANHPVDAVEMRVQNGNLLAQRRGPLPGAAQWTHQYGTPGHDVMSPEHRVRLPIGILWFGGPNNHDILPRHSGGPRPHVVGGRIFYLGVEEAGARCVYTGRRIWTREFPGIGHHATNMGLERRWRRGEEVYMTNIPGATYIGSPIVSMPDAIYLRHEGVIHKLDPATGETVKEFALPGRHPQEIYDDEDAFDWGHIHAQGDYLVITAEPHLFEDQRIGWNQSHTATSSRRLAVLDRYTGRKIWEREAQIGFRHNAIVSHEDTVYLIDGLSETSLDRLARRGLEPDQPSAILALDLSNGRERWSHDSEVFGTFLMYIADQDILIEGGSQDLRRRLRDEPQHIAGRRGATGELLWTGGNFVLPGAALGEKLIPGRPGPAISLLTGERWERVQPLTGETSEWRYRRAYGCNTLSASPNFLFYRSGYASYFDLANDSGTGNFSGIRSGCTANMIAADGVISALDYTRTCTCSYAMQTSLAMVHMPDDPYVEQWTRYDAASPDPAGHGLNFGAPGRRIDRHNRTWFDHSGHHHRHPSAIQDANSSFPWVLASYHQGERSWEIEDLLDTAYTVRLHFAELQPDVEPGERVFEVWIDGEKVLDAVDVTREAGGTFKGVVHELKRTVSGNRLQVELKTRDGSARPPIINGIELVADLERTAMR